jgi:sporulation protein YlmC with PRC-barrel domain
MLRSIKELYGHSLRTAEGEIGTVKDFYFDDQQWAGAGMGGFPMVPPPNLVPIREIQVGADCVNSDDPHLRRTKALTGYHIATHEGATGHVTDFMIDDRSWAIRHLVVETGHWFAGKEIALSPSHGQRISYDEFKVFVDVTKETIRETPEYHMPEQTYHDTRTSTNYDHE